MSTIPAVPQNTTQVKPWTGQQWVNFLIVTLLLAILAVASYGAVQAHRANTRYFDNGLSSDGLYYGGGSGAADASVADVCTLLGAVAKKQGIEISTLFGPDVTDCATAATAAKP